MSFKDIITNRQKIIQDVSGPVVDEVLSDENHRAVLQFLFDGPLTVEELEIAFKQSKNDKSDKSIYRYLNKLKKAGLIIEAGKRIYSDEDNQIRTQTLFSRVAKIIYHTGKKFMHEEIENKSYEILSYILQEKLGLKDQAEIAELSEKTNQLLIAKHASISELFQSTKNERLLELLQELEIHELYPILDFAGWIILFEEHPEIIKELIKCFR
ncbi:MAG: winged helix-turn-helix transcriptional regulator [Asgard group archaeon]|nr:winged helix-turn-helix transcriptional regulator [Asgard group archaeon]